MAHEKFPDRAPFYFVVYADGHAMVKLSGDPFLNTFGTWEVGADGVLTFLGVVGNDVKRFRITPASDMTIDKMITRSQENQAAALANAAAAKKKADEYTLAAKEKRAPTKWPPPPRPRPMPRPMSQSAKRTLRPPRPRKPKPAPMPRPAKAAARQKK